VVAWKEADVTEEYKHIQVGYLTLGMLGAGVLVIVVLMATSGFHWIALAVLIILALCSGLFATLTVRVDEDGVRIWFGPGVIRKRFPMKEIASCQVVRNPWYYGWGIRLIPHGWLYNVSGFLSVELRMKSGRRYRIGTDDPGQLGEAVRRAMGE